RKVAKAAGIELIAGKAVVKQPRLSAEMRAKIIAALEKNSNATQVAKKIGGVTRGTVSEIAKAAGIELAAGKVAGGQPQLSAKMRAKIIAALEKNSNAAWVANEIGGVSKSTVHKIAKAVDIELIAGKAVGKQPRLSA